MEQSWNEISECDVELEEIMGNKEYHCFSVHSPNLLGFHNTVPLCDVLKDVVSIPNVWFLILTTMESIMMTYWDWLNSEASPLALKIALRAIVWALSILFLLLWVKIKAMQEASLVIRVPPSRQIFRRPHELSVATVSLAVALELFNVFWYFIYDQSIYNLDLHAFDNDFTLALFHRICRNTYNHTFLFSYLINQHVISFTSEHTLCLWSTITGC